MVSDPDECVFTAAAWAAVEKFAVEAKDIELVDHSENLTYRVRLGDGLPDYALRIHRPGYNSVEELNSEHKWIHALHAAGLPVPQTVSARDGRRFVQIDIPGNGEPRYAGLSTWLDGTALSACLDSGADSLDRASIFYRIGEIAAAVHNHSASWSEPAGFTRRRLDLDGLLGDVPHWGRFWEGPDMPVGVNDVLLRLRDELRETLGDYGRSADNFSLIHADLDPDNIVFDGKDLALIDFDDAAYGWHMYDIASALFERRFDADHDVLKSALLDGYRAHRSLDDRDLAMLPAFTLVRGMGTIGWYHQRPEHAQSAEFARAKRWILEQCESHAL